MPPILEVSGLSYSYHTISGETKALSDISFQVETGEFIAIVGPSGCGKSTLLSLISGLLPPEEGSILINGVPLSKSQCRIGYMLQSDQLFEWRTIIQNAALGLEIQKKMDHAAGDRLHRLLKTYGLEQFEHSRPSELSGGMRQRAALIRTLALEPDLLLLDEPTTGLDPVATEELYELLKRLNREKKTTILMVSHDLNKAVSDAGLILHVNKRSGCGYFGPADKYLDSEAARHFLGLDYKNSEETDSTAKVPIDRNENKDKDMDKNTGKSLLDKVKKGERYV